MNNTLLEPGDKLKMLRCGRDLGHLFSVGSIYTVLLVNGELVVRSGEGQVTIVNQNNEYTDYADSFQLVKRSIDILPKGSTNE